MAKTGWLFSKNAGTGTSEDPNRPSLDAVGGRWTSPGDIIRLTGPGASPHRHLLVGGIALPDANVGDGHTHYIVKTGGGWQQVTVGAVDHTHTLPEDANGNLIPEWYMVFWAGSDADAATINADSDNHIIVEAAGGELDNIQWTAGEQTAWDARVLDILGVELPSEVDRGKRLVQIFLGALLSRHTSNLKGYQLS